MKDIISAQELKQRLDQDEILLIDVREPAEHYAESIPKSHLIPLNRLCSSALPIRNKVIVTHCRFGRRSSEARKKLLEEDPSLEVYSLEGGLTAWKDAGYAILRKREG